MLRKKSPTVLSEDDGREFEVVREGQCIRFAGYSVPTTMSAEEACSALEGVDIGHISYETLGLLLQRSMMVGFGTPALREIVRAMQNSIKGPRRKGMDPKLRGELEEMLRETCELVVEISLAIGEKDPFVRKLPLGGGKSVVDSLPEHIKNTIIKKL